MSGRARGGQSAVFLMCEFTFFHGNLPTAARAVLTAGLRWAPGQGRRLTRFDGDSHQDDDDGDSLKDDG